VLRYFSNLEFLPDTIALGASRGRAAWTWGAYLLFSAGIFARQITDFPTVDLDLTHLQWSVLAASFIIGLAVFPPIMRWLNRSRRHPGWEHVITAFGVGFFLDLSNAEVLRPLLGQVGRLLKT
jgi:hypothetical protein